MGKRVKHPHTHTPAFIWDFGLLCPHCPGVLGGVNFCLLSPRYCCSLWGRACGCMQVTSVPSEVVLVLLSKGSHEQGSSACQHGASLTFGVLLKVLMEGRLRGLCPLQPSCGSVLSLLTACSLFKDHVCLCHSRIGTVTFGWLTWAGLLHASAVFKRKWNSDAVISCV